MEPIVAFFNSNFFVALTTIVAGLTALYLYNKQKSDNKKDAAKTIYSELVYAERIIGDVKKIKQNQALLEIDATKYILGESSWIKFKYHFINEFDANEWEKINTFFNQRDAFDKTIKDIANLFPKNIEYRTKSIQEELAKLASEQAKEWDSIDSTNTDAQQKVIKKYENLANTFRTVYVDANTSFKYLYTPSGTYSFIEKDLDNIDLTISTSSVGQKLKKISK